MADVNSEPMPVPQESSLDETAPLVNTKQRNEQAALKKISLIVYVLVMMFSLSSWISVNGMWVEVPLFVDVLPEKWNLPSYLVVIIQIANIGPLLYVFSKAVAPDRVQPWPVIYLIIIIGGISCILLSLFWHNISNVGGKPHSMALFVLTGFLALVDCTSSVVYLPYMAQFKTVYMTAFYIGEGLSGLLPGLVGLLQGTGSESSCINQTTIVNSTAEVTIRPPIAGYKEPRFSVGTFFLFLFSVICISGIAFAILHHVLYCWKEHIKLCDSKVEVLKDGDNANTDECRESSMDTLNEKCNNENTAVSRKSSVLPSDTHFMEQHNLSCLQYVFVLALTAWVNVLQNGILPSTQSYSCLPYGTLAYTLTVRLSTLANPLLCFLAFFLPTRSIRIVAFLTLVSTVLASYQLALAVMSPEPPLKGQISGVTLVVSYSFGTIKD